MSSSDTEEPNEVQSTTGVSPPVYTPHGDPAPAPQSGWVPTTSTIGGGVLGGAVGQVVIAMSESVAHVTLTSATAGAITTIAVIVAGYLFPDGGRK